MLLAAMMLSAGFGLQAKSSMSLDDSSGKSIFAKDDGAKKEKDDKGKKAAAKESSGGIPASPLPAWATNNNAIFQSVPPEIMANKKYVFFIPCEKKNLPDAVYQNILKKFAQKGYVVISTPNATEDDFDNTINKVAGEIEVLISGQVAPNHISIIGIGKGGVTAFRLAARLKNQELNVVLVSAIPRKNPETMLAPGAPKSLSGSILNIYDRDDEINGSCRAFFKGLNEGSKSYRDRQLKTGKGGKLPVEAVDTWVDYSIRWIK